MSESSNQEPGNEPENELAKELDQELERALAHHTAGRRREAEQIYSQVLSRDPDNINALRLLGILSHQTNRSHRAVELLSRAVELTSDEDAAAKAVILLDLGRVRHQLDDPDAADELFRRALALDPKNFDGHSLLATNLARLGFIEEATEHAMAALSLRKSSRVHSNLCLLSLNDPALSPQQVLAIHRGWDRDFGAPSPAREPKIPPHANHRALDRRLRIGYVSPDFRQHAVRYFIQPILMNHDRANFHVTCYSNPVEADAVTGQFAALADQWRDVRAMTLDQLEAQVRSDQIDILVDLAGHTQGSAITLFARKPAPVQVSMIGYPSTTGLSAIDYRITDVHCDPVGNEAFSSEKLVRIDGTFWCFAPLDDITTITDLPAKSSGRLTFGSVNSCSKLNDSVLDLWARIIAAVPKSILRVQHAAFKNNSARKRVTDALARHGVSGERARFTGFTPMSAFLDLLSTFDMALDPFPFNGGTTTCHLLHAGVPVIALAGRRHASRMGVSMLHAIGHPELIAQSADEYFSKAIALASDVDRLAQLRAGLRDRMLASALCDARGYTRKLEAAFRAMWKTWCES